MSLALEKDCDGDACMQYIAALYSRTLCCAAAIERTVAACASTCRLYVPCCSISPARCYRLPADHAGDGVLPPSWAEISRAAVTTIGTACTAPSTLAGRRALLQRCLTDLIQQRGHLLRHAAALEFLGLRRSDPACMNSMHADSTVAGPCTASPSSAACLNLPEDSSGQNLEHCASLSHSSNFGSGARGALLGGLTLGQEPPVSSGVWRSRSTSPSKSMHRSPAKSPIQTPNGSSHQGTAYSELLGGLNLSGSGSDFGFEKVPANLVNTSEPFELSPDAEGAPRTPNRHLKMIMHEPHELQLSEAEVARRQQGMCMGCMRTLGAVHEVMHEAPVDTWRSALQSRSSIVSPQVWEHGSLGGRALETIGSIQNLLKPKHRMERPRRCFYDGCMYCEACHAGEVCSLSTIQLGVAA